MSIRKMASTYKSGMISYRTRLLAAAKEQARYTGASLTDVLHDPEMMATIAAVVAAEAGTGGAATPIAGGALALQTVRYAGRRSERLKKQGFRGNPKKRKKNTYRAAVRQPTVSELQQRAARGDKRATGMLKIIEAESRMSAKRRRNSAKSNLKWYQGNGKVWRGEDGAITVAEVRYAKAGEVEGGLGALARHMGATHGLKQPALAPAGWYWMGTVHERGVWTRPAGPYKTAAAAKKAADAQFKTKRKNGQDRSDLVAEIRAAHSRGAITASERGDLIQRVQRAPSYADAQRIVAAHGKARSNPRRRNSSTWGVKSKLRLIAKVEGSEVRVYKDPDTGEFVVKPSAKAPERQWNYTPDKQDAIDTAKAMAAHKRNPKRKRAKLPSRSKGYKRTYKAPGALSLKKRRTVPKRRRNSPRVGPSVATMVKMFSRYDVTTAQAKEIKAAMQKGRRVALETANRILGGHGIESIGDFNTYPPRPELDYVNMGNTYSPTLVYDYRSKRFSATDWGGIVERNERRFRNL